MTRSPLRLLLLGIILGILIPEILQTPDRMIGALDGIRRAVGLGDDSLMILAIRQ